MIYMQYVFECVGQSIHNKNNSDSRYSKKKSKQYWLLDVVLRILHELI